MRPLLPAVLGHLLVALVEGNYVKDITGGGLTDGVLEMYGADLGIAR